MTYTDAEQEEARAFAWNEGGGFETHGNFYPLPCVECGGMIKRGTEARGHESFHAACLDRMYAREDEERQGYFGGDE